MWKPSPTPDDVIMHSAKGSSWKKHKYIAIKNGKYIYPDTKSGDSKAVTRRLQSKNLAGNGEDRTDAYKRSQRKASEHAPHFEGKAGEGKYTYKYRTNSPGTSGNQLNVPYGKTNSAREAEDPYIKRRKVENPSHMRSDVERWDYFAGAAAKYDSTKKRMAIAKSLAKDAEESHLGQLAKKKPAYYSNPEQKKWETAAKSAGYRQKQKEALAKKNAEAAEKQKKNAAINETNLNAARLKYQRKKKKERQAKYESDRQKKIGTNLALSGYTKEAGRKTAEYKKSMGIKPVNKTARKNQRKAALEKAKYKAKSTLNKIIGKSKSTVTDTFTGKKRPASKSGTTINIKQLSKKNKKKK